MHLHTHTYTYIYTHTYTYSKVVAFSMRTCDTVSSTPTRRCTHFFFFHCKPDILIRSKLRTFDCLCITSSTSLTHSRSSNHRRAVDQACYSWNIGHYDRYCLRKFVKSVRADHVQIKQSVQSVTNPCNLKRLIPLSSITYRWFCSVMTE